MKYFILGILAIINITLLSTCNTTQAELSWKQDENSLSLLNHDKVVWQLNYDKSEDKPYFYPLRTLDGIDLALQRPEDHPWHRGLWFSWKTINGVNYWEEDPETGLSPGRTKIIDVKTVLNEDYSAHISFKLEYAPEGESALMYEYRTLTISAPNAEGDYKIDWTLKFTADDEHLTLDREVPLKHGGVEWGGYAGLGYRANDLELDSIRYIDSNGWSNNKSLTGYGEDAKWMDLSGIASRFQNQAAGLTIFDHPTNRRHPSPWYVWYQKGEHAFYMPAFLYNKPFYLQAGESFSLRYRVLVHNGMGTEKELAEEHKKFTQD